MTVSVRVCLRAFVWQRIQSMKKFRSEFKLSGSCDDRRFQKACFAVPGCPLLKAGFAFLRCILQLADATRPWKFRGTYFRIRGFLAPQTFAPDSAKSLGGMLLFKSVVMKGILENFFKE